MQDKDNQELESLKSKAHKAYDDVEKVIKELKEDILKQSGITLPEGFDMDIRVEDRYHSNKQNLRIVIEDKNLKQDEGDAYNKYFWTQSNYVEMKFRDGELKDIDCRTLNGGYNGHEFGNPKKPEIDIIKLHEIMQEVNGTQLSLLKIGKNNPKLFLGHLENHFKLNKIYEQSCDELNDKRLAIEHEDHQVQVEELKTAFPTVSEKDVKEMLNQLITSEKYIESIKFTTMTTPKTSRCVDVTFKRIELECKHGDKTTYSVKVGSDEHKRIKAADVKGLLSRAITFNGEHFDTNENLQKVISSSLGIEFEYPGYTRKHFNFASFNTDELLETISKINQKVDSTIDTPKQTEPSKKFKNV